MVRTTACNVYRQFKNVFHKLYVNNSWIQLRKCMEHLFNHHLKVFALNVKREISLAGFISMDCICSITIIYRMMGPKAIRHRDINKVSFKFLFNQV